MAASKVDTAVASSFQTVNGMMQQSSAEDLASQEVITHQHDGEQGDSNSTSNSYLAVTPQSRESRDYASETSALDDTATLQARYELPRYETPLPAEMEPIEKFVVNAMRSQEPGGEQAPDPSHVEGYRAIIASLKRPSDPPTLRKLLIALRTAGNGAVLNHLALGSYHAQLVHLIIRFNPTSAPLNYEEIFTGDHEAMLQVYEDYSLCDAHFHLLLAMVSAKSTHVLPILSAVWKNLTRFGPILDDKITQRLHAMLFNIMRLVPKSTSDLFPLMSSRFPFYRQDKKLLVWYAKQCLHVLDYLPSIRQRVLELLIDKCLEIDVNIFIKDNGDAIIDDEEEAANKPGDAGNDNDAVMKVQEETKRRETVDILSDKLDALLELLFQHIRQRCKDDVEVSRQAFHELLPIFESSILTTHKSKFVQYCMFLSCGLESQILTEHNNHNDPYHQIGQLNVLTPEKTTDESNYADEEAILYREFAAKLLEIIVDPYRATTTRQSAACYLASFISRASFVSAETICESVSALMRWAEAYIQSLRNDSIRASDARIQSEYHALFYTVCQAAFYIMCFRGQEAIQFYRNAKQSHHSKQMNISDENSHASQSIYDVESIELSTERWTFLCGHQLQPLRFCLESVRSEFLHVAHFFSLIEENVLDKLVADAKRLSTGRVNKKAASIISTAATLERRRQTGGVGGLGRGSNPLKSFFPFDPLLLRQSHEIIEPLYRYWQGPVEEEDVLVIDEGNGIDMDEPAFEMDETLEALADAADEEDEESEDDIDDENSENASDEDGSNSDDASATGLSHTGTAHNDAGENDDMYASPEPSQHKLLQQKAWTETLKRPRSYSMENGSW